MRLNSYISIKSLHPNTGQIPGVPANPRQWTNGDVDRLARSIDQTPELLEARPVIVYPAGTDNYVILGGNLRFAACKQLKRDTVPCYIVQPDLGADKLKEIVIKDNGAFGQWDFDQLANEWDDLPLPDWGVPSWDPDEDKETPDVSPENFGETFSLPDGEKEPFRQVAFQLSNEMAEVLLLATKAAQFTDTFYEIAGDGEDVNTNGVAIYIIAKEWCDRTLQGFDDNGYERAKKDVEELRQYLRASLEKSGKKAVDVDNLLGTNGMSGHYFGSSQWLFPTRAAYEKMKEIMPLPRDYFECKIIEMRFNLLETLKGYRDGQS